MAERLQTHTRNKDKAYTLSTIHICTPTPIHEKSAEKAHAENQHFTVSRRPPCLRKSSPVQGTTVFCTKYGRTLHRGRPETPHAQTRMNRLINQCQYGSGHTKRAMRHMPHGSFIIFIGVKNPSPHSTEGEGRISLLLT